MHPIGGQGQRPDEDQGEAQAQVQGQEQGQGQGQGQGQRQRPSQGQGQGQGLAYGADERYGIRWQHENQQQHYHKHPQQQHYHKHQQHHHHHHHHHHQQQQHHHHHHHHQKHQQHGRAHERERSHEASGWRGRNERPHSSSSTTTTSSVSQHWRSNEGAGILSRTGETEDSSSYDYGGRRGEDQGGGRERDRDIDIDRDRDKDRDRDRERDRNRDRDRDSDRDRYRDRVRERDSERVGVRRHGVRGPQSTINPDTTTSGYGHRGYNSVGESSRSGDQGNAPQIVGEGKGSGLSIYGYGGRGGERGREREIEKGGVRGGRSSRGGGVHQRFNLDQYHRAEGGHYRGEGGHSISSVSSEGYRTGIASYPGQQPRIVPIQERKADFLLQPPPLSPRPTVVEKRTEETGGSISALKLVPPRRPYPGKAGIMLKVQANHFKVTFHPGENIYQYDVDINPKISSKGMARMLERQLIEIYGSELNGKLPVYDGSKSMYTHGPLPFQHREFVVTLAEDRGTSGREKKFTVTIRHVSTLNRNNLEDFLKGRPVPTPQEHLQALDVLLREHPALHFTSVSRSFFKKELGSAPLEGGLVAINGFYQSLRPTHNGLQLNVDLSTTAFHASIPVIDFLKKQFKNFDPRYRLTDVVRLKVKRALSRLKVQVIHRQTPRRYRISGLSTGPTKDLKFPMEGGEEMRVVDYFKATYNCVIEYPELPCLQVQANKASYLPMEVCVICDGQKYGGKLNDRQTKNLRDLACVLPRVRESKILSIMNKDDGPGRGEHVLNFGVEVVSDMTLVNARLLPPPRLRYGDQGKITEITPKLGAWNLLNSCVVEGGSVAYWGLISFDQDFDRYMANDFVLNLSRRCNELGIRMAEQTIIRPLLCKWEDLESPKLEKYLRLIHEQASEAIHNISGGQRSQLQLLVCVMADKHPAYGDLKRICETQIGIVTQCCLSKHVKQRRSQYLANLALKVNAKVGGRNVTLAVELPRMCSVFDKPTIIFGADVTHPSPGDDAGPSIAAVVANIDWPSANKYVARVRAQAHREEIIENLQEMVEELWHEFCDKTESRPERVIMFRDGVSEGQFDEVLQREVVALKDAFEKVGGRDYKPLITWAVVQKRHHTRLFPADAEHKDKNNNILPGTVVDSTITHPREFDFFLCSHAGIQGTSRPTHYHVLWDENDFNSDDLQGLVYNLCYTYARCTRSVSVVPPAYYAHLAAYRARLYLDSLGGSDTSMRGSGSDSLSFRGMRFGLSGGGGGGGSSRASAPTIRALPRVQRNVQEVMYFC